MGVECFIALHAPRYPPGHAQTSLEIIGPRGEPPLMYVRSIIADCADGRWSWHLLGQEQDFEQPDRYLARRIRDRFDRPLLIEYLAAVGIAADDPGFYGRGVVITQQVTYDRVQLSAAEVRRQLEW